MHDHNLFYSKLFEPLEAILGPIDANTIVPIIGFDAGGPLSFCTIGFSNTKPINTYVSCEMAVRQEQRSSRAGRYELIVSCDDERWVRSVITDIAHMSCEVAFGDGHTLDIEPWVGEKACLQGVIFEKLCDSTIDGSPYCILRVVGVTRGELEFARETGVAQLIARLKDCGVYPNTLIDRESVL